MWTATARAAALCLAAATAAGDAPPSRSVTLTCAVSVESIPATAESVNVWVPVPRSNAYQTVSHLRVEGAPAHRTVIDPTYGNRFVHVTLPPGAEEARFTMFVDVIRHRRTDLGTTPLQAGRPEDLSRYLRPQRLVRTDGPIAEEARRVAGDTSEPLLQARKFYDHIVDTVAYDKSGTEWGRGDSLYACDVRKGNCTDFHSLFIGEARSLGLPARFLMGFSIPAASQGTLSGYHCWAEVYVEDRGWIAVDASEARKDPSRRDALFGGLDEHRVLFTMGRDIVLPAMQGTPLNYSIYPYAEVDGRAHEAVHARYSYRNRDQDTHE